MEAPVAVEVPLVFVNCPYDPGFEQLRDAYILAVVFCGFTPTSALTSSKKGQSRVDRIITEMKRAAVSIHDLSRCHGLGERNLARFNMPLELGMAMMLAYTDSDRYDWLALVPSGVDVSAVVSDLAGFDPVVYDGTAEAVIRKVVSNLALRPDANAGVTSRLVLDAWPEFLDRKRLLVDEWGDDLSWKSLTEVACSLRDSHRPDPEM